MLPVEKLKKIISTDYNELYNHIIEDNIESDNRRICYSLFKLLIRENRHNFRFEQELLDNMLNYSNLICGFSLFIFKYNKNEIVIRFTILPYEINTHKSGEFSFVFKTWLKAAKFLVQEKNCYLKMISTFSHLKQNENFKFEKSKSHLKNFEVYLEDSEYNTVEFFLTEKSEYF